LEKLLRKGSSPARLRRGLLSDNAGAPTSDVGQALAQTWLRTCDESASALRNRDLRYFVDRLPASEHLRILKDRVADALYLDIETTGLSPHHSGITVIGALFRGEFHQWVWPQAVDGLRRLLLEAELVVTFNGRRFDVPFLRQHLSGLPAPRAHVDLLYVTRRLGISGGQKAVEEHLRLSRPSLAEGIDGHDAINLWSEAVYGNANSLARLLAYNRADCELLAGIATRLCANVKSSPRSTRLRSARDGHRPSGYGAVHESWMSARPTLSRLLLAKQPNLGRVPRVVGIDLRGNPNNPTGWALCEGGTVTTLEVKDDSEIYSLTRDAAPDLISIDAPLALPRGRMSAFDDSPCRATGGIVRDAERILWSRGIGVYPALIPHMQGLTSRGIELAAAFRAAGLEVIESYPGAAQDILGIPRKKRDLGLLRQGLADFGFVLCGDETHDELDAITSAMVGYFYLADEYEPLGAPDECFLIVPRSTTIKEWPALN
jgi:uncharacterized protein YprB with RNaseH-like and TPR domain/predicted nuclease with RNAse H fold